MHNTVSPFSWSSSQRDVILVRYLIEAKNGVSLDEVVDDLVNEFKGSAWTDLPRELLAEMEKVEATIAEVYVHDFSSSATITVAYPACHFDFETGGFSQLLALIAGDNISSKNLASLRITDLFFPPEILKSFPGPAHGVSGVRERYQIPRAPLLQVIMKPRLGLTPEAYADLAGRIASAGAEAIREDQMMVSTRYSPFETRVALVANRLRDIEQQQGRPVLYYPNVCLSPARLGAAIEFLRKQGIRALTINAFHQGIGVIEQLREIAPDFIIQAHRSGYVLISNNRHFSISYAVLAQLYHLAGADEIHIGSVFGRFDVKKQETLRSLEVLSMPPEGLKPGLPVISGNVFPGLIEANIEQVGNDVILMAGSAIIGHPSGVEAGVRAFKEMTTLLMESERLERYLSQRKASNDLLKALNLWPYKKDGLTTDVAVQKEVAQLLAGRDLSDPEFIESVRFKLQDYRTQFEDDEIGLIFDSLSVSGRAAAGIIGQIAEKYVRKICMHQHRVYKQFFDALQELEVAGVLSGPTLNALHAIRMAYNKAKHKDIFIFLKEIEPLVQGLFIFFDFFQATTKGPETVSL